MKLKYENSKSKALSSRSSCCRISDHVALRHVFAFGGTEASATSYWPLVETGGKGARRKTKVDQVLC